MLPLALALAAVPASPPSDPAHFQRTTQTVIALAEASRPPASAAPGLSVVMVREGQAPVIYVDGVADARTGAALTPDTPFYIASMTKAYVGLMAEALDQRGVFDLDQSMADIWPDLTIKGVDPARVTFRQLLTHQGPFRANVLSMRTAYVDEPDLAEFPALLAFAEPRAPGFEYQNTGYLLYGAALQLKTGKHWRQWLRETVLDPLGLDHTSTRMSVPGVATTHHWIGDGQWDTASLKTDPLMHAAGGMVTSSRDMAVWLQANLRAGDATLPPEVWSVAHRGLARTGIQSSGLECQTYALGWNVCLLNGETILLHGGGYSGARTWMAVAPERGVGIAVMANSDSMTGDLGTRLLRAFLSLELDPAYTPPEPAAFGRDYAALLVEQAAARGRVAEKDRREARWRGWAWTPTGDQLDSYVGRYRGDLGEMVVVRDGDRLRTRLGMLARTLEPASADLFAAQADAYGSLEEMAFTRTGGTLDGVVWGGDRYTRVEEEPVSAEVR